MSKPLRAAVIGVGYLGRFHAQKYHALPDVTLSLVIDADLARAKQVGEELNCPASDDYRSHLQDLDMVSIATPTENHFQVAGDCIDAGIHTLVEKPLTRTVQQAQTLIEKAKEKEILLQVGHLERFNPAVVAMKKAMQNPVYFESHRVAPFKPRGIDVDVVYDLMIHDIDILMSMNDGPPVDIQAIGDSVLTPYIDIANARLEFAGGCVANLTASRLSRDSVRKMRVFAHNRYASIDSNERKLFLVTKPEHLPEDVDDLGEMIKGEEMTFEQADILMDEIKSFVAAVRARSGPHVSGEEGRDALWVAAQICAKIESSRQARSRS